MASKQSSMSSVEHVNSAPPGVGATLGENPCPPQDDLSKPIRVALQLEARKLPNLDTRGLSDPFVVLYQKSDNSTSDNELWREIGRTETVYNNLDPKWSRIFNLEYRFGTTTTLRFSVYDRDEPDENLSKHDYIGEVRCTLAQVVLADNQRLVAQINNKNVRPGTRTGTLIIRAEEQQGDLGDNVTLQFAATGLRRARKPFYVLSNKNRNDDEFSPVFYSEVHRAYAGANHVTTFMPLTESLARLTNGDMNRELEVRFMDYDRGGNHYRGGSVRFTLREVKAAIAASSPARFALKKHKSNGHVVEAGHLIVNKCEVSVPFSFIDYIRSGVEINTVIAIDMSATNGNPFDPHSLHHNRGENEYMIALREVGSVLAAYDTTQRFPAYGFGAAQAPDFKETVHCFPLLGPDDQPVRDNVSGVIDAYRKALVCLVAPGVPCRYGPVLKHVIEMTRKANTKQDAISYTVLLLFTDGDFVDFADVANLICDGAELPLSIVIVGVGNSRFLQLERLDGDEERLCSTEGIPCARDIVQFVQFHKHRHNSTQLAREVLDEIPEQLVSYMRSKGLKPTDIRPLRKVPSQAPPAIEEQPYLPEPILKSIPSSNSALPTPEAGRIPDTSLIHCRPQSNASLQHNNSELGNIPTVPSSRPAVSVSTSELLAPGANFHQPLMPPQMLQPAPTSRPEPVPSSSQLNRPLQPSHEPPLQTQGSTNFHQPLMPPQMLQPAPTSRPESVPSNSRLNRPLQPSHEPPLPTQGSTNFHQRPMASPHGGQPLHPGPPHGAESLPPPPIFNRPAQASPESQPPSMPLQGSGHHHASNFLHPQKPHTTAHEPPSYGLVQGHPHHFPGGYGNHGHVQNEPYHFQPNFHQPSHHQSHVLPAQYQEPSPYHHSHAPHSQQPPIPSRYGSYPYPYQYQPPQYGVSYSQAPQSDPSSGYPPYPGPSGQPYSYPQTLTPRPSLEIPYQSQYNGPNYPTR